MTAARVRGELGPACAKCGLTKIWCGTRFLCRPCQAQRNRDRKARLSAEDLESERVRANELRNARRLTWTPEKREASNAKVAEWREANRERHRELSREWYERNAELKRSYARRRYEEDPTSWLTNALLRRARLREAVCGHGEDCVSSAFLADLYAQPCLYCGAPATDADHYMPLSRGGLHCRGNLVPACEPCNGSKYNHDPIEWMRSRSA